MIRLEGICHSYNGDPDDLVLEDISFTIAAGECVGLTGPSGSGKSTLANITAGHVRPTAGKVFVDGRDRTGQQGRQVFLIHQESDLFPWQRVRRQILFALGRKDEHKAAALIDMVRLSGYENYFPNQLSGGMKKRLAIARALALNPKLMILDESFGSLDSNLKFDLYRELKRIWKVTNTTILLITHDSKDLENLAEREIRLTARRPTRVREIVAAAATREVRRAGSASEPQRRAEGLRAEKST